MAKACLVSCPSHSGGVWLSAGFVPPDDHKGLPAIHRQNATRWLRYSDREKRCNYLTSPFPGREMVSERCLHLREHSHNACGCGYGVQHQLMKAPLTRAEISTFDQSL